MALNIFFKICLNAQASEADTNVCCIFASCFTLAWNWACHIKGWTQLKAFKFRVWRKIFGHQREEVMGGCRKYI